MNITKSSLSILLSLSCLGFTFSNVISAQNGVSNLRDMVRFRWKSQNDKIDGFGFLPNSKYVFTETKMSQISFHETLTGNIVSKLSPCSGKGFGITPFSFGVEKPLFATGCRNGTAEVWNYETGKLLKVFKTILRKNISDASISYDRLVTYGTTEDSSPELWNLDSDERIKFLLPEFSNGGVTPLQVEFSSDNENVAISFDTDVYLWDATNGKIKKKLMNFESYTHQGNVWNMVFSPDSSILATGGNEGLVKLWYVQHGQHLRTLNGHQGRVEALAISQNTQMLATGGSDKFVNLWDIRTGSLLWKSMKQKADILKLSFSPTNDKILVLTQKQDLLYDVPSGRLVAINRRKDDWLSISPDWRYIAIMSYKSKSIQLFETVNLLNQ